MNCNSCNSKNIRKRKNYSHGKSSKGVNSYTCKECNSSDIEMPKPNFFRKRR